MSRFVLINPMRRQLAGSSFKILCGWLGSNEESPQTLQLLGARKASTPATRQKTGFETASIVMFLTLFLPCPIVVAAQPPKLPHADPNGAGMNADRLNVIDDVITEGIRRGRMPGAVVTIGYRGKIIYFKAFGHKQLKPTEVPMTTDTLFDMASITKPVATATSVLKLVEQGKINLRDPVAKYLREFGTNGKEKISIYQLLTHQGGLTPDNALKDYNDGTGKAFERIDALKPIAEPGTRFIYTDVGFIVLARVVQKVSGLDVHRFSQKHIFQPLGMTETGFLPEKELRDRAATTQEREGRWMKGEVHDPRAYKLGGIAGHAGLFSTARDLAVYAQTMLNGGVYHDVRILDEATLRLMTGGYKVPRGIRGLGWDVRSGYSSNRGDLFSSRAFGHGGFTGTTLWMDPESKLFVIFLSNRVHPDGKGSVNSLAGRIGTIASAAIENQNAGSVAVSKSTRPLKREVLTGIDVLQRDGFEVLKGRRIGLITNHTGVDRKGVRTVEILHRQPEVNLVALFSPEHGIAGKLDIRSIGDSRDPATQLKIYSLYGKTRTPTAESLKELDTLVFDIQDIGTRFYTYISTMGNAMRAAAQNDVRFVVLDRPNPINGLDVSGPVLDEGSESFVGFHRLPVRHGMTAGELARMFNAELELNLDLHVVRLSGWKRSDFFDATGLRWINPSPNMRNLNQALLYPGIGLLETTNLSVGRGTDTPFEVIGAPWIDGFALAKNLNGIGLPGVRFVPVEFQPDSSKYAGTICGGIQILITDRSRLQPLRTGLEIALQLRRLFPKLWDPRNYNRLLANRLTLEAVLQGKEVDEIEVIYRPELELFLERRKAYLLYE